MSEKRQHIVETAFRLFSENGFHATGIDQIIAESKTSKKTLYAHFNSKNALIAAVLEFYGHSFFSDLEAKVKSMNADPCKKLMKIFEIAQKWYRSKKFNGCLAISAMNEFGNKDKEIVRACLSFKTAERDVLLSIARDMNLPDAERVADYLMILLEGIGATAHMGSINPSKNDLRRLVGQVCNPQ